MAGIQGMENMTVGQLQEELDRGAKFVVFEYCISILVMTFRRSSDVYFIRAGESTTSRSIGYTLLSLFLGWWGIPWGFIYTPMCLATNLGGGKDVTEAVVSSLLATAPMHSRA